MKSRAKAIYDKCVNACNKYKPTGNDFLSTMNSIVSYEKRCQFSKYFDVPNALKDIDVALQIISDKIKIKPSLISMLTIIDAQVTLQNMKSELLMSSDFQTSFKYLDSSIEILSYCVNYLKEYDTVDNLNNLMNNPNLFRKYWIKSFAAEKDNESINNVESLEEKIVLSHYYHLFLITLATTHKLRSNKTSRISDFTTRQFHCESCIRILESLHNKVNAQEYCLVSNSDLAAAYIEMGQTYTTEDLDISIKSYSKAINLLEDELKDKLLNSFNYPQASTIYLMGAYLSRGLLYEDIDDKKSLADIERAFELSSTIISSIKKMHNYMKSVLLNVYAPIHFTISYFLSKKDKKLKFFEKTVTSLDGIDLHIFSLDIDSLFNLLLGFSSRLEATSVKNNPNLYAKLSHFILNLSTYILSNNGFSDNLNHLKTLAHTYIIRASVINPSNHEAILADYEASINILNTLPDDDKIELLKALKSSAIKSNLLEQLSEKN